MGYRRETIRTADDFAFGMLLNGCPAVVMEVPKAVKINHIKKSREEKHDVETTNDNRGTI